MVQSDHLRITWVIAIHRYLHCACAGSACEVLGGLVFCESPWRRRTPGALCCRSGFPPIPAETHQRYFKRSPLTVLFRLQVQKYFLARLWLILADPTASAIQQFLGSKERVEHHQRARR